MAFAGLSFRGQRCTTTRRLYLHSSIAKIFLDRLIPMYDGHKLVLGDPLNPSTLVGPLHNKAAVEGYERTLAAIKSRGGQVLTKREGVVGTVDGFAESASGHFVWPVVVKPKKNDPSWKEE